MTQEIRHTIRPRDNSTVLLAGEIAYADSETIKVGDGLKTFAQLPSFASNNSLADNSTMDTDANNKLQVLGTVNKNTSDSNTVVFDWIGTVDEYTAQNVATAHPDWLCFITDDLSGTISSSVYTKGEIDAFLADKADGQGSAVMTSGNQSIDGTKTFLNGNIVNKTTSIDSTQTPAETEYFSAITTVDKNNKKMATFGTVHHTNGDVEAVINACVEVNGTTYYSPSISTWISQDGQRKHTYCSQKPSITDNDKQIATSEYVMDVLKAIYPVGSIYIGTQATCPMGTYVGTWTLVSSGKALWTGDGSAGNGSNITNGVDYTSTTGATNTISAGLPNIKGSIGANVTWASNSGAFTTSGAGSEPHGWDGSASTRMQYNFDASLSNSIYSDNVTTVQPPAYVVNVWRRTA